MRNVFFVALGPALTTSLGLSTPAFAQVNDAERAAARDLFKQGDELQRDAHFEEALSKFQRAQQIFAAPTNQLRIAECEAALGRIAESAEAYRSVLRTPLPAGSPPAFQAAVGQARAELEQVEPRVPKLTIVVQPANVSRPALEIDGQGVPAALIGEAMPLDPGAHRIALSAPGYASAEQTVVLKEREARVALLSLRPISTVAEGTPPNASPALAPLPRPPPIAPPATPGEPPPPPPVVLDQAEWERPSWKGWLLGAHLGGEWISGMVPVSAGGANAKAGSTEEQASDVVAGAFAYGLDAGFRFARRWYVGLVFDHANYQSASGANATAYTTLVGAVVGAAVNPNRTSFYGEAGLAERWLTYHPGGQPATTFNGGEIEFGAGLWLPVAHAVRLLPKATITLGALNGGNAQTAPGHAVFALVLTGFYNIDL